ncbi:dynamin family protein [Phlyctema vagabunda]|uniref:Dynamin family protein n=1 Tax=Phlyctema vagabunda TaxID=108571 RepID=A0ABR4PBK6_9HELO
MNKAFSDNIASKGYTRRFRSGTIQDDITTEVEPEGEVSSADGFSAPTTPKKVAAVQLSHEYPELKSVMGSPIWAAATPKQDIMRWITTQYERWKAFEIGTLNPSLFLEQSQSWKSFASGHVENVVLTIHHFNHKALQYCCKDATSSKKLWARLSQLLLPKYKKSLDHAKFLVDVERQGNLLTMNHYFADNLRKAREDRIKKQLIDLQSWATPDK